MPRSHARKSPRSRRHRELVVQPHRRTASGLSCSRCHHHWPCPSAVEGKDLTHANCGDVGHHLSAHEHERVALAANGLIVDTGVRRRHDGEWHIVWSLSRKGRRLAPQLESDLRDNAEPPDDEDMRQVLRWLQHEEPAFGTRREMAERCGRLLSWPTSRAERALLWAEANGFLTGPDSA